MTAIDHAGDFFKLFSGNRSFYVEHIFDIDEKKKKKSDKVASEAYFKDGEVTEELYLAHLSGRKGLGICPIDEENKTSFGVIDIDSYGVSYENLVNNIYEYSIPLFPFRTKSGGLHLYLFLKKPVAARSMIDALEKVCATFGLKETYQVNGKTKVEIIPKQARLAAGGHGATITIPYFRCTSPKSYMYGLNMSEMSAESAVKAIRIGATSIAELEATLKELPYSDAPRCIQTILLGPSLEENSGRNNFLYSCAVYLKKKHGDNFYPQLKEINESLKVPQDETATKKTYESVKNNEFNYKCHDIPCEQFCNKGECAKREFGIGKEKGHFTGLDYGKLTRYKAEEPYYVWELKCIDDAEEKRKKVTFKSSAQLTDQRYFSSVCIDQLNFAPVTLSDVEFKKILNTCLSKVEEKAIGADSDTSTAAEIRSAFYEYLSQKQTRREMPYQIKLGLVYVDGDKYYFTHKGFSEYLDVVKLKLVNSNLREALLSFGAEEGKLEYKARKGDATMSVPCWIKTKDAKIGELQEYFSDVIDGDIGVIEDAVRVGVDVTKESTEEEEESLEASEEYDADGLF